MPRCSGASLSLNSGPCGCFYFVFPAFSLMSIYILSMTLKTAVHIIILSMTFRNAAACVVSLLSYQTFFVCLINYRFVWQIKVIIINFFNKKCQMLQCFIAPSHVCYFLRSKLLWYKNKCQEKLCYRCSLMWLFIGCRSFEVNKSYEKIWRWREWQTFMPTIF